MASHVSFALQKGCFKQVFQRNPGLAATSVSIHALAKKNCLHKLVSTKTMALINRESVNVFQEMVR